MIIEKVVAPENLSNKEAYGTRWIADLEIGKQIWIQCSVDEDKPSWVRLGMLYEEYFLGNDSLVNLLKLPAKVVTNNSNS